MSETPDDMPAFPLPRSCPFDPPDLYAAKRQSEPIFRVRIWNGEPAWVVTRYQDGRTLLTDRRLSADSLNPRLPHQSEAIAQFRKHRNFIGMDSPEHLYYRRKIADDFGPKHMEKLRPAVEAIVDRQLDAVSRAGAPAELVSQFALPVTSLVICELLGVPYADHELFERLATTLLSTNAKTSDAAAANEQIWTFLAELFDAKRLQPAEDVLSNLAAEVSTGALTREEALNTAYLLLIAGHETTAGQIGLGVAALLTHADQMAELAKDPGLADNAVEEILRYVGVSQAGRRRVALADIDYNNVRINRGDGVIVLGGSSNRDEDVFEDANVFDIHRSNASAHVEFGAGTHICLGRPLARLELQSVFRKIFARFPTMRLAVPFDQLDFKYDAVVYGLRALPVTW